jgi:hypothetical protein
VQHDVPYALALYDEKLGRLECDLLRLRVEHSALRRRIELVVAQQNRGLVVTEAALAQIDAQLATELISYWDELHQREREVRARCAWLESGTTASPADVSEVRKLYRELCRRLHPDATGGETEVFRRHWPAIQAAYRDCDLEVLRALSAVLIGGAPLEFLELDGLREQCQRLDERLGAQADRLAKLHAAPPLCYLAELEDPERVLARRKVLLESIAVERARKASLDQTAMALGVAGLFGRQPWARA